MARLVLFAILLATVVAASWIPLAQCAETVTCYNSGRKFDRAKIISAINSFCTNTINLSDGQKVEREFRFPYPETGHIDISAEARCSISVSPNECNRLLRRPTDECNTGGENGKQGGFVEDNCKKFKMDPNA
ncbi:hypothetical protein MPTK1_2g03950 [Marchantia polymorpha subsp. ruderalis]|uniref:Uncharacterized protein n=1 Tax=Marchantia polymorpha TaxID=3197 RepID=A0A2R6X7J0_MARPO|nr:hypothetical protein MARPO_0031s0051 [Marchantia polymorpha]BBN01018.1 hypothetical protein Mp_2g03950 [Marchantia polymorpha subsp. ruderalis]|eukprot:PTQ42067.1 hypothetical protein MARPO_0031s0051 [Marchantia polymorpha]